MVRSSLAGRRFVKMHGLGNDFVVIDARTVPLTLAPDQARLIADRRRGVGCDQLIVLEPPRSTGADVFMRILNPDASEAGDGAAISSSAATTIRFVASGAPCELLWFDLG